MVYERVWVEAGCYGMPHPAGDDPSLWGRPTGGGLWRYHERLVRAAVVLQRAAWRRRDRRRAGERARWSEVSRGHLNWHKSRFGTRACAPGFVYGRPHDRDEPGRWPAVGLPTHTGEARFGLLGRYDRADADRWPAPLSTAEQALFAAIRDSNWDQGVLDAQRIEGANLDCVEIAQDRAYSPRSGRMPLDLALNLGHGAMACWILDCAGSGRTATATHAECVPSALGPEDLLQECEVGADRLMPSGSERGRTSKRKSRQRHALAEAVHTVLQSSHVRYTGYRTRTERVEFERDLDPRRFELVDLRAPGALSRGWCFDKLLGLAAWTRRADLAVRLYLVGTRFGVDDHSWSRSYSTPEPVRRFVARAVVRALLRRFVKTRLIMWYWREAAERGKYAAPDAAGFEEAMAAPVFAEGALGA